MESTVSDTHVVVVGGGIAGITCADELVQGGLEVTLVEKEADIGGWAAEYCCKATERCNRCFVCVSDKKRENVRSLEKVTLLTGRCVQEVGRNSSGYVVRMKKGQGGTVEEVHTDAVVFATGFTPFDATKKGELGYSRYADVITGLDLERMLRRRGNVYKPSDGEIPEKVAFIQCVGSRDESMGHLYCSKACCAYALRMARVIRSQNPDSEISFFYMDIQPAGRLFDETLKACEEDPNFHFIRAIPSKVYQYYQKSGLMMKALNPEDGNIEEQFFDMIVLSIGMEPNKDNEGIWGNIGLKPGSEGFVDPQSCADGIFLAGTVSGPKDIERSIMDAKQAAFFVLQYLEGKQ